eukprot:762563-Hanusia_phi.AAC.2
MIVKANPSLLTETFFVPIKSKTYGPKPSCPWAAEAPTRSCKGRQQDKQVQEAGRETPGSPASHQHSRRRHLRYEETSTREAVGSVSRRVRSACRADLIERLCHEDQEEHGSSPRVDEGHEGRRHQHDDELRGPVAERQAQVAMRRGREVKRTRCSSKLVER